jgi:5-carboxymethyl-2-hydroxymuconate isomerase
MEGNGWQRLARVDTPEGARAAAQIDDHWLLLPGDDIVGVDDTMLERALREGAWIEPQRFLSPTRSRQIIGVGLNYASHAHEVGAQLADRPLLFAKMATTLIGDQDTIMVDESVTQAADWEVELAVVIGQPLRRASQKACLDGILGFTVANDVTARDIQFSDVQWTRSKSLDTFCPLGPWIVPPRAVDHANARLRARLNGVLMQDGSTDDMVFDVPTLLSFCSWNFTLYPGDVILTGTPPGVGAFRDPPRYLQEGDVIAVEIDGIGILTNSVAVSPAVRGATWRA